MKIQPTNKIKMNGIAHWFPHYIGINFLDLSTHQKRNRITSISITHWPGSRSSSISYPSLFSAKNEPLVGVIFLDVCGEGSADVPIRQEDKWTRLSNTVSFLIFGYCPRWPVLSIFPRCPSAHSLWLTKYSRASQMEHLISPKFLPIQ